jgi:NitT/TauT family transport system substrate-binding protein
MVAAGLAGATAVTGARRTLANDASPETTSVRLAADAATCDAPFFIFDDLLRDEGFADVRYVSLPGTLTHSIARGGVDFGLDLSAPMIIDIEAGIPMVMLGGVHAGCIESFLVGKLYDDRGSRMGPSHARKGSRCWRYYISRAALAGRGEAVGSIARTPQIETFVVKAVEARLKEA